MSKSKTLKEDIDAAFVVDINVLCKTLKIDTMAGKEFVKYALANCLLFERKQLDYGPRNISGFGTFGIIVRANDKFERLKHLFTKRNKRVKNETVEDTLRDIGNYAIIAQILERGEWPLE